MTTSVTDEMGEAFEAWKIQCGCDAESTLMDCYKTAFKRGYQAALRSQGKLDQVTVCCSRRECGGECGNEWQGMRAVRRSGEETIMAIMGADNMDHAIRILDEYANLTAIIGEGD